VGFSPNKTVLYKIAFRTHLEKLGAPGISLGIFRLGWPIDGTCWISEQWIDLAWKHSGTAYPGLRTTGWASSWTRSAKP